MAKVDRLLASKRQLVLRPRYPVPPSVSVRLNMSRKVSVCGQKSAESSRPVSKTPQNSSIRLAKSQKSLEKYRSGTG
jgi:hypothetical protein